ncbi:aquaporin SIP1-1 [Citrus sinensis]|uniref:aquaporin SIP1-1 n=1 Tax=Citrus sinensis TaxID=2711 RepID=UPI0021A1F703|nr:aquaporin SIP1-1 [Citrus sinensis]KAH9728310.1 aquaporin SIP1-1 [Citrus sinensis]
MGPVKAAAGDLVLTFMWVFVSSTFGVLTTEIASALGVHGLVWPPMLITTAIVFVFVFIFNIIGEALGGASFNPTGTAAFYAVGVGSDSLLSMALRFPAQAAGAVGGALAIMEYMPPKYKHMLGGPSLQVDLHTGAIAEGLLTFLITFAVLVIMLKGPQSNILKTWLVAVATVVLIVTGSAYTGPSMNPANAFGWAYVNKWHDTWDQFYVYWICPFIGAVAASMIFRVVFPPPAPARPAKKKKKN